jgi:hypothetical protein
MGASQSEPKPAVKLPQYAVLSVFQFQGMRVYTAVPARVDLIKVIGAPLHSRLYRFLRDLLSATGVPPVPKSLKKCVHGMELGSNDRTSQ